MIDIFTRERTFSINGQFRFKTIQGGIQSIFILIGIAIIAYFLGSEFFEGSTISLNKYQVNEFSAIEEKWNASVSLIIGYPKKYDESLKMIHKGYDRVGIKMLESKKCTNDEYFEFYSDPRNESLVYYCGVIFNLTTNPSVNVVTCNFILNSGEIANYDNSCKPQNISDNIFASAAFKFYNYKPNNYNDHLEKYILHYNTTTSSISSIHGSFQKYISDEGFFSHYYKINHFYSVLASYSYPNEYKTKDEIIIIQFTFHVYSVVVQSFQKIPEILAKIMSVSQIFYISLFIINNLFFEYLILKKFLITFCNNDDVDLIYQKIQARDVKNEKKSPSIIIPSLNFTDKISLINQEFNFTNYIKFNYLYLWSKESLSNFSIIYDQLKYYLSFEKVISKSLTADEIMEQHRSRSILSKIDIFGNYKTFLINGERQFKTTPGFIMTIIYFAASLPLYYFIGQDFFDKTPKFNVRTLTMLEYGKKSIIDTPIMVSMNKKLLEYSKLIIEDEINGGWRYFPGHECSDSEIEDYYGSGVKRNETNSYLCSNLNLVYQKLNEFGGWTGYLWYAANCTEKEVVKLGNANCSSIPPDPNLEVYTAYGSITKKYNITDYEHPLQLVTSIMEKKMKAYERLWFNKKYSRSVIEYDNNPIYANTIKDHYVTLDSEYFSRDTQTQFIFSYTSLGNIFNYVTIKYKKFSEMLADSGSVIAVMNFMFFLISFIYYDYLYDKIFIDSFLADENTIRKYKLMLEKPVNSELSLVNPNSNIYTSTHQFQPERIITKLNRNDNIVKNKSENEEISNSKLIEFAQLLKNNEFALSNYLSRLVCCCKNREINDALKEHFMKFASFERLIQENKQASKSSEFVETIIYKPSSFLEKLDFLSGNRILYIQNHRTFKTDVGGLLTIILIIMIILLFSVQDFFYKKNPKIDYYNVNYNELDEDEDKSKYDLNFLVIIAYSQELNSTTRHFSQSDGRLYSIHLSFIFDCADSDLKLFEINRNKTLVYKCILAKDILVEYYRFGQPQELVIFLKTCSQYNSSMSEYGFSGDNTCIQDPNPNKIIRIEYYFNLTKFDESSSSNFLIQDIQNRTKDGKYLRLMTGDFGIRQNRLLNDDGIFTTHQVEYLFTNLIDSHFDGSGGEHIFRYTLSLPSSGIMRITRSYQKLPEMLAQVFSIAALFNAIFKIASSIISDYLYFRYILSLYKIKTDLKLQEMEKSPLKGEIVDNLERYFNFANYFYLTYLNFICKRNVEVQQCKLLKEKLIKFISIEEYLKPLTNIVKNDMKVLEGECLNKNPIPASNFNNKSKGFLNMYVFDNINKEIDKVQDNNLIIMKENRQNDL